MDEEVGTRLPRVWHQLHAYVRLRAGAHLLSTESSRDLTQSICGDALRAAHRVRFVNDAQFMAWLFKIASCKFESRRRTLGAQKRDSQKTLPLLTEDQAGIAAAYSRLLPPLECASHRESIARLEQAMDRLPDDYFEVIVLTRILELPHREASELMGRTEVALRQLLARALAQLGALLASA